MKTLLGSVALAAVLVSSGSALSAPLFFDDFESGLGQWNPNAFGQTVADPTNPANTVLNFSGVNAGGDIFSSSALPLVSGVTYKVEFDFYGVAGGNPSSGGFAGIGSGTPGNHGWYAGTVPGAISLPNPIVLADGGVWNHYVYSFVAPIVLQGSPTSAIRLIFEDFSGAGSTPANAYFDNVQLSAVPVPAALPLMATGIAVFGYAAHRRRRREAAAA